MTRGLYVPGHYVPNPSMTDEELLQIAGLTNLHDLGPYLEQAAYDPVIALHEQGNHPMPDVAGNLVPEIPLRQEDQNEIDSRLPDIDFVPEHITDPRERKRRREAIRAREADAQQRFRREGQWGGQQPGMVPGSQAMLINWTAPSDAPMAVNVQFAYTIDAPSTNTLSASALAAAKSAGYVPPLISPSGGSIITDDTSLFARVEWGSGRATHMAYCDFQAGSQIRLTGSFVRITALYLPTNLPTGWPANPCQFASDVGASTGPALTASAILGQGHPTFTTAAARFTRKVLIPGLGGLLNFDPIPPFASAFGISQSAGTPSNTRVRLDWQNTGDEAQGNFVDFTLASIINPDNAFMIPTGARFLTITNNNAVAAGAGYAITYALMF